MDTFKRRLEFYMNRVGLNPTSLSRKARLSITTVRDILEHSANPKPRIDTFAKLCRALGVSPHHLSPDFSDLYSPRQRRFLTEIEELDERERRLMSGLSRGKSKKARE